MPGRVIWTTRSEARDVTALLTGQPDNLPEDERIEMTDWDKFADFWNRVAEAPLLSERKENKE